MPRASATPGFEIYEDTEVVQGRARHVSAALSGGGAPEFAVYEDTEVVSRGARPHDSGIGTAEPQHPPAAAFAVYEKT